MIHIFIAVSLFGQATLYVDSVNGNDANSCALPGPAACKTMQRAATMLTKQLSAPVEISAAPGNYACSSWDGFRFTTDADAGTSGSLWLHGTWQTASMSGMMSGTVASATDITDQPGVLPTVSVADAGWSPHQLRGAFLQVTGGTGSGEILAIADNASGALTVAGGYSTSTAFWPTPSVIVGMCTPFDEYTLPDATSTFAIVTPASHITSDCPVPAGPGVGKFLGSSSAQPFDTYGISVTGTRGTGYQGAFTLGGNAVQSYCSPQASVAITGFDFNDANMGTAIYAAHDDAIQARWNTFSSGYEWDVLWQDVGRVSIFSNYAANTCLAAVDAYAGDTALIVGNVAGALDRSAGCLMYDGQSYVAGPRELISGLNHVYLHAVRTGYNVVGTQLFNEFDDTISGASAAAVMIGQSSTADVFPVSAGTNAQITSSAFWGTGGEGIWLGAGNSLRMNADIGDGGAFGVKVVGPAHAYFDNAPLSSINALTGSSGDICQDPTCAAPVPYTQQGFTAANLSFAPQGGSHNVVTANLAVPATQGCSDTAVTSAGGALVGLPCHVSPQANPTSAGGAQWSCYASAAGTLQLHLCCVTSTCTANLTRWNLEQQ